MLLGQIFSSINAWQKLSSINMKPKMAYRILKYTKKVSAEHEIAEKQRVALIHEVTNTKDGEDAKIEPDSPEFTEYVTRFNEIMATESALKQLDMDFEEVVNAVDEKDESLTVQDLALLEPFFLVPGSLRKQRSVEHDEPDVIEFRKENGTPKMVLDE